MPKGREEPRVCGIFLSSQKVCVAAGALCALPAGSRLMPPAAQRNSAGDSKRQLRPTSTTSTINKRSSRSKAVRNSAASAGLKRAAGSAASVAVQRLTAEMTRLARLPPQSRYRRHREKVLNSALDLASIPEGPGEEEQQQLEALLLQLKL